jgi:hypothetical protein
MSPTKYKEINELLEQLLLQIRSILTGNLIGMYIGGSLVNNNFNCETSDIDCYIITTNALSKNMLSKIEEMHKKFYLSNIKYAQKIEVSYVSQNDILHFDPSGIRPYFNEGCYYLGQYGNNFLIELYILRENGIAVVGPNIKSLVKEITIPSLKLAMQKNLYEFWEINLNDLLKFKRSDYQVFAILTMCRTLYSLETGNITSKIEAAQWAMQKLDGNWKNLIAHALVWKPSQELNKLEETQKFVRYALNKCHEY